MQTPLNTEVRPDKQLVLYFSRIYQCIIVFGKMQTLMQTLQDLFGVPRDAGPAQEPRLRLGLRGSGFQVPSLPILIELLRQRAHGVVPRLGVSVLQLELSHDAVQDI